MFCGGVVLEKHMLKMRRAIALYDFEAMDLEYQCSTLLESNLSLQQLCGASQASLVVRQTMELDDAKKRRSQQSRHQ